MKHPRRGYYDDDEWKPKDERGHEPEAFPIGYHDPTPCYDAPVKKFDRPLWLREEMGFHFVHRWGAFVNDELEEKFGNPLEPMHTVTLALMESQTSTGVFQWAVWNVVEKARGRKTDSH